MNQQVRQILSQITKLEDDLHKLLNEQQIELRYRINGTKVSFEKNIREAQKQLKTGIFSFIKRSQPRNVVTAPVIYSLIIPLVILDAWVSLYQAICFPLYRIPKVKRSKYIIIDRHNLAYLNSIEKLNCIYCGYCGGVFSYTREIAARTEQYWCPIKHARKILDPHRRYAHFVDFGQGEEYHQILGNLREELRGEKETDEK
ncbi:MAG: hypothetical protein AB8D52_10005 [Gammaproteobacteria bacterium]